MFKFIIPFLLSVNISLAMMSGNVADSKRVSSDKKFAELFRDKLCIYLNNRCKEIIDPDKREIVKQESEWLKNNLNEVEISLFQLEKDVEERINEKIKDGKLSDLFKLSYIKQHESHAKLKPRVRPELVQRDIRRYVLELIDGSVQAVQLSIGEDYRQVALPIICNA